MKNHRILVVSSANIDFVQRMRRLPYSGETVIESDLGYSYVPGGRGSCSAISFARFGADCIFTCKLGNDSNAKRLLAMYQKEGIDTRYTFFDDRLPTGLSSILVEDNGKNRVIAYPGANMSLTREDVENSFTVYPDAVFLQFEIPDEAIFEAADRANEDGIPIFVDACPARLDFPLGRLGKVEIFSANESETRVFTGVAPTSEESCLRAAIKLASLVDAKYIVLKLGQRGSFIFDGREYYIIPAEDVEAVDTTGVGDIFSAVMTYVYLSNKNIVSAVKYATCAAAISVTRKGSASSVPTREEVLAYVKNKLSADNNSDGTSSDDEYSEDDE
ncbi:MAG: ribokinase [Ruminococcaceae bacterium]|nr:ribokinase [Oscillospiraceae bacterium]